MGKARRRPKPLRLELGGLEGERSRAPRAERFLGGRLEVRSPRGVRGPEALLLEALGEKFTGRALVVGSAEGLVARAAAALLPDAEVHLLYLDAHDGRRARAAMARGAEDGLRPPSGCSIGSDLPESAAFDWVALPVRRAGEAALAAELLRQAFGALRPGGKLAAAVDNPRDHWILDRIGEVFGAATLAARSRRGVLYIARKTPGREPRRRDSRRRFRARLFGRELELETRPGVFSHGELDEGTLALAEIADPFLRAEGERLVDIGCGSGALGIGAALASPGRSAILVDSSARAVRCARLNALHNGAAGRALVTLGCDLAALRPGAFDRALANPPYYGSHRIAERFASEAQRVLAPGGELFLVAKERERHREILDRLFGECEEHRRRGYTVFRARKGGGAAPRGSTDCDGSGEGSEAGEPRR